MKKHILSIALVTSLALFACSGNKEKNASVAENAAAKQEATFKISSLEVHERYFYDKNDPESPSFVIDISIPVVEMGNDDAKKKMESIVTKGCFQEYTEGETFADAINGIREIAKDFRWFDNMSKEDIAYYKNAEFYINIKGTASTGHKGCINYVIVYDEFAGGAHPNYGTTAFNISPVTGDEMTFDEIFKEEASKELTGMIKDGIAKHAGVATFQEVIDNGYIFDGNIFISNNIILGKDTTTFIYNTYDIAPRAFGEVLVKVPNDKIRHLIR